MQVDLQVTQLLCSRLCHDLVGPVGAINTGLELLDDAAVADGDSALGLMARSAGEAQRRLAFFRVAFGLGGGSAGATVDEARGLARDFLNGGKVALEWPPSVDGVEAVEGAEDAGVDTAGQPLTAKVVLNMVLIGAESLPRGGVVRVRLKALDDGLGAAVTAAGDGAGLKDDMRDALGPEPDVAALTARNVHGHFAQCLARAAGGVIEHSQGDDGDVRLAVLFPGAR